MLAALEVNRKSQDHLVLALSSPKWKERNWCLHLYGDGKDRNKLAELIEKNMLNDRIFLKGHTNDPEAVLRSSHLLLQMTKVDAMPLSVVEAMAIGRPVVASRIGDMPQWVTDSVNGWISADASINEIDKTLERAWQQKDQWKVFGEKSFAVFKSKYPSSVEAKLLEQIDRAAEK
jgi:glycosyltransferase involved in cell wall biosynthesis